MPTFDSTAPQTGKERDYALFETGEYPMTIVAAKVAPGKFPNKQSGEIEDELTITYELDPETPEQEADFDTAGYKMENGWMRAWDHMPPWFGDGRRGPSKLKARVQPFIDRGLVPAAFHVAEADQPEDQGDLIGLKVRVMIEKYTKTMGPRAGEYGNRVLAVNPRQKAAPKVATPRDNGLVRHGPPTRAPQPGPDEHLPMGGGEGFREHLAKLYAQVEAGQITKKDELTELAKDMASEAKGFWPDKNFDAMGSRELIFQIRTMWKQITNPADPNEELF